METTGSSTMHATVLANGNRSRASVLPMQHGKALPPAVNDYIRRQLLAWLAADPTRKQAHLAVKLNVSAAHMTNVLKNGRGGGYSFEADVASLLGIGVEELRRRAAAEYREPEGAQSVPDDRYPNRARRGVHAPVGVGGGSPPGAFDQPAEPHRPRPEVVGRPDRERRPDRPHGPARAAAHRRA